MASIEWERRVEQLWTSIDDFGDEFVLRIERLVSGLPADDPVGLFEYAGALDATDRSDLAISADRRALELGLGGGRQREAVSAALTALSRHLTRYRRSLRHYARLLVEPGVDEE